VAATAAHLERLGLKRGDTVGCYLEEQVPSLFFDLACALKGVVPVPLSPVFSVDYFVHGIVEPVEARAVFTDGGWADLLVEKRFRPLAYGSGEVRSRDGIERLDETPDVTLDWALELAEKSLHGLTSDDTFVIQPTSGCTGLPKLVRRHHNGFLRYARFVGDELMDDGEPHRFLLVASLNHAFGMHMLATMLRLGAAACVTSSIDTQARLEEIRERSPTVVPILPRVQRSLYMQFREERQAGADSGRMFGSAARFVCSAGGPGDIEILSHLQREGLKIIEFYGSTEASVVAVSPRDGWRPGCAGRVVPDVEASVSTDGELIVRSPGVAIGYVGNDVESAFVDGAYRTGDFAEISPDGYLRILGRKRDIFNTPEGSNIYPGRIEDGIEGLPWVEQAVVVGDRQPFLTALIVVRDNMDATGDAAQRGLLPPAENSAIYHAAGLDLARLNLQLERIEHIVRFLLFSTAFPADVYAATAGKVRRQRANLLKQYKALIATLYVPPSGTFPDPTHVPGKQQQMEGGDERIAHAPTSKPGQPTRRLLEETKIEETQS
jgi:long-subunit acyl-CoA synthetase (AMP-forming)